MAQKWVLPLDPQHSAVGTALASTTTLTDISTAPTKKIPANFLLQGMVVRMRASGLFSTTATPTILLGFYYGAVVGVALAASAATTTGTGAAAWPWILEYE